MNIGRMRHRVTLQIPSKSENAFNEWIESWSDWVTVWASIEPNAGKRYFEAQQANSEVQGLVRIRYRDGVLPTMRVKYGDRYFEIIAVVHPQERRRELLLYYKEALD